MAERAMRRVGLVCAGVVMAMAAGMVGCERRQDTPSIEVDGSSTVYPIMTLTAEWFEEKHAPRVTVTSSGTGAGFSKFLADQAANRIDISDASRPIKPTERERAEKLGVEFIELPIAYDGVAVVVNPANSFCDDLTLDELQRIWKEGSTITNWSEVRDGFPDRPITRYGPTGDSGTYEYFTEVVNGKARSITEDYAPSQTTQIVQAVTGDEGAIGFFGYSYYKASEDRLKLVAVARAGGDPIKPSTETINDLSYPLARPLFIYVSKEAAQRTAIKEFVNFFFDNAERILTHENVNYVPLSDKLYQQVRDRFENLTTGTVYPTVESHSKSLYELYGISH